jgi:hypothetical protein
MATPWGPSFGASCLVCPTTIDRQPAGYFASDDDGATTEICDSRSTETDLGSACLFTDESHQDVMHETRPSVITAVVDDHGEVCESRTGIDVVVSPKEIITNAANGVVGPRKEARRGNKREREKPGIASRHAHQAQQRVQRPRRNVKAPARLTY